MAPRRKLLSSTRPRSGVISSTTQAPPRLSSQKTRALIRQHHTLQKRLSAALATKDASLVNALSAQIEAAGGLPEYQRASIQGQAAERGGDSSKVLVGWLDELRKEFEVEARVKESRLDTNDTRDEADCGRKRKYTAGKIDEDNSERNIVVLKSPPAESSKSSTTNPAVLRLLEVGSLRPDNAIARTGIFDMTRIDLHSQHAAIVEQDFMQRPLPENEEELARDGFDVVSLSLVVNYVGDAVGKGEMLKRVGKFLRRSKGAERHEGSDGGMERESLAGLFLVLPAPCVENSRYLDRVRMRDILKALGYEIAREKMSSKLVYYYCLYKGGPQVQEVKTFGKTELRKGKDRNNFSIIIR